MAVTGGVAKADPHDQLGIDRAATSSTLVQPQPIQIDEAIDGAQHAVGRNVVVQSELVKKKVLVHRRPIAHHRRTLPIHPERK